jgi:hypothetical protein
MMSMPHDNYRRRSSGEKAEIRLEFVLVNQLLVLLEEEVAHEHRLQFDGLKARKYHRVVTCLPSLLYDGPSKI